MTGTGNFWYSKTCVMEDRQAKCLSAFIAQVFSVSSEYSQISRLDAIGLQIIAKKNILNVFFTKPYNEKLYDDSHLNLHPRSFRGKKPKSLRGSKVFTLYSQHSTTIGSLLGQGLRFQPHVAQTHPILKKFHSQNTIKERYFNS